jgi:hypothetical protein
MPMTRCRTSLLLVILSALSCPAAPPMKFRAYSMLLPCLLALGLSSCLRAQSCLTTLFASNNGGGVGGVVYFDMTVRSPVTIESLRSNFAATANSPVGIEFYLVPGGYFLNYQSASAWSLAAKDNGAALAAGPDQPTRLTLDRAVTLTPGTYGVALIAVGAAHLYTDGNGLNQSYRDSSLQLDLGAAYSAPWSTSLFSPRVWNGAICYRPAPGLYAEFDAQPRSGASPMQVQFTDQSFTSSAKGVTEWAWDFDGDDIVDSTLQNPQFTYIASGWEQKFTVTLTVKDGVHAASKVRKQDFVLLNPFPDARAEIFGSGSTSRPLPSPLVMPSFSYTYSALGTRGYWFEVPSTMRLTGFQVPNEGSAPQMAAWIVQLPAAPSGSVPITAKETLFLGHSLPSGSAHVFAQPIPIQEGTWVGVLGAAHGIASRTMLNSYGNGDFTSSILGRPSKLRRLTGPALQGMSGGVGTVEVESSGLIGRVELLIEGNLIAPVLRPGSLPVFGSRAELELAAGIPNAQGGLLFASLRRYRNPGATPWGDLWVDPTQMLFALLVPGGSGQIALPVPKYKRGFAGFRLLFQAGVFDLSSGLFGFSNGVQWTIGQ